MIRINLLQQKKAKRTPKGQQDLALGMVAIGAAAMAVYFFVHKPLADRVDAKHGQNARLSKSIKDLQDETKDFDNINTQFEQVKAQKDSIQKLNDARAVPAWFLKELSSILTKDHQPTMTPRMAELVKQDHKLMWTAGWDPKKVWINSIDEKGGRFTLKGGAQSDADVTQLALRLQASAYFADVVPEGGQTKDDDKTKISYYEFTITGRVVY